MTLAALEPRFWSAFCQAVGRDDLLGQQLAPAVSGEYAYDELCQLFRSRTRLAWTEDLSAVDACCEPVYTIEEALASAPVKALGLLTQAGLLPPVRLSTGSLPTPDLAPILGEHTEALLLELGYDQSAVSALRKQGVI